MIDTNKLKGLMTEKRKKVRYFAPGYNYNQVQKATEL